MKNENKDTKRKKYEYQLVVFKMIQNSNCCCC